MKGRRRKRDRTRHDPVTVDKVIEESLNSGQFTPYHCAEHGKHFMLRNIRPECPVCGSPCFTPDEWAYRTSSRLRRKRRVQMLRNHLE